jgi:hypothetical protein
MNLEGSGRKTYTRCSADFVQQLELLLLHYPAQAEIGDHDVRIFRLCTEEEVFGFEIYERMIKSRRSDMVRKHTSVDYSARVDVLHCLEDGSNEIGSIAKANQ